MRILVACEFSGIVRDTLRSRGHDAWSYDLLPCERGSAFHYKGDLSLIFEGAHIWWSSWDAMFAFPPCTDLAVSGARWFKQKREDGRQQKAIDFFLALANAPIPRIAIENPIGIMSRHFRPADQIIQPWMFGHGETKATCLWLKNLPELQPTKIVEGREARIHKMPPSPDRWKNRSRTYQGIADAMAEQWGSK